MKKIFLSFIVMLLMVSTVFGWNDDRFLETRTYIIDNDGVNALFTKIPEVAISPRTGKYIGIAVFPYDYTKSAEMWATAYDTTTEYAGTYDEVIDEAENTNANNRQPFWQPYPRIINLGLAIHQGPNTRVIVYFENM